VPEVVAEGFDDVIGRDADVRGAAVDHPENRSDDAADGADLAPLRVVRLRDRIVVAEELVRAVDEVDVHPTIIRAGRTAAHRAILYSFDSVRM
jgi:hypothetical protein